MRKSDLDGIACTAGPGLIGALLAGLVFSGGLARALGVALIGVHHMEAHLLAPLLEGDSPEFPYLALLVSGGHSLLVDVRGYGDYAVLGESLDDAAGEAFDKGAKLLGLGYPGGPEIARLAEQGEPGRFTLPDAHARPQGPQLQLLRAQDPRCCTRCATSLPKRRSMRPTAPRWRWRWRRRSSIRCSTGRRADWDATGYGSLVVAGGVGANRRLRSQLKASCDESGVRLYYPRVEYCTDNGAMIALTGCLRLAGEAPGPAWPDARPRWNLSEVAPFSPRLPDESNSQTLAWNHAGIATGNDAGPVAVQSVRSYCRLGFPLPLGSPASSRPALWLRQPEFDSTGCWICTSWGTSRPIFRLWKA